MALLIAPNGEQAEVPDSDVQHFLAMGAKYPPPPSPEQEAIQANPFLNPIELGIPAGFGTRPATELAGAGANAVAKGAQALGSAAGRSTVGRGLGAGALELGIETMLPKGLHIPARMALAMLRGGGGREAAQVAEQGAARAGAQLAPNAVAVPAPGGWSQAAPTIAAGAENLGAAATRTAGDVAETMQTQLPKGYHLVTQKAGQFLRKTAGKAKEVVEKAVEKAPEKGSAAARVKLVPKPDPAIKGEKDIAAGIKWIKDKQPLKLQAAVVRKWIEDKVPDDLKAHALAEARRLIGGF